MEVLKSENHQLSYGSKDKWVSITENRESLMKQSQKVKNNRLKFQYLALTTFGTTLIGFIFGDFVIGIIAWVINGIKTARWGHIYPFRIHYGIIFAVIGLLSGPIVYLLLKHNQKNKIYKSKLKKSTAPKRGIIDHKKGGN